MRSKWGNIWPGALGSYCTDGRDGFYAQRRLWPFAVGNYVMKRKVVFAEGPRGISLDRVQVISGDYSFFETARSILQHHARKAV